MFIARIVLVVIYAYLKDRPCPCSPGIQTKVSGCAPSETARADIVIYTKL